MTSKVIYALSAAVIISSIIACTDDPLSGPGFICDVTNPVSDLFLDPSSSVLLVHSPARETDTTRVTAVAINRVGGVRNDVPIKFVSSDTLVATVDSLGIIHARKPGAIRVTASTCGKSAESQITVAPLAVTVRLKLDTSAVVAGDSLFVRARAIVLPDTNSIAGAKLTFSVSPASGIAVVQESDSTALVKTSSPGSFTITATGEGATASAPLLVAPRVFIGVSTIAGGEGALDVGRDFGCGIISLGRLYCWGVNEAKQLGATTDSTCFEEGRGAAATKPCSLYPLRVVPAQTFVSASAGDAFTCGIVLTGAAFCWGEGNFGKLGTGNTGGATGPTLVTSGLHFTSISAGGNHACGIATSGGTYCWGQDSSGQLGDARFVNSTTPIPVSNGSGGALVLAFISAGFRHTCGLQADGTALCWGQNQDGELGGASVGGDTSTPVGVVGGLRFTSISAGGDTLNPVIRFPGVIVFRSHTCGIAVGGAAYCWGSNDAGQLGIGSVGGNSSVPVPVAGGLIFAKIASGGRHTCGLTTSGAVYCWGRNFDLELGRGPATGADVDSGSPQLVTGGGLPANVTFTAVSAGMRHSCGIGSDGAAYCWGSNVFGALGNTLQAAFRGFPQRVATPQ